MLIKVSLAAIVVSLVSSSVLTKKAFDVGSVVSSSTRNYLLVERIQGQPWTYMFKTQSNLRSPKGGKPLEVFLRCAENPMVDQLLMERDNLRRFQSESWCPRVLEEFRTDQYTCIASEMSLSPLQASSLSDIMSLGLQMLSITEDLHKKHSVNHRSPLVARWSLRKGTSELVLSDLYHLRSLTYDRVGYHRIMELQQIGLNLRHLWNMSKKADKVPPRKGDIICPGCPEPLAALVRYVRSINPENGEFPEDMYSRVRALVMAGIDEKVDKLSIRKTVVQDPKRTTKRIVKQPTDVNIVNPIVCPDSLADEYHVTGLRARGHSSMVYEADMRIGKNSQKVVLKCFKQDMHGVFDNERRMLDFIRSQPGAIRKLDELSFDSGQCMALEFLHKNIVDFTQERGILPIASLMNLAENMWTVIRGLHFNKIAHGNIHARNWRFRDNKMRNVVLIDYGAAEYPASEKALIQDIKRFAMVLRYLRDLDPKYDNGVIHGDINTVCPNEEICPQPFRNLLAYILSLPEVFDNKRFDIVTVYLGIGYKVDPDT